MEKMLHLLETFSARGSDGKEYVVHGYEHMVRVQGVPDLQGQWEPTGLAEYKLADGSSIDVDAQGVMTIAASGVQLTREAVRESSPA